MRIRTDIAFLALAIPLLAAADVPEHVQPEDMTKKWTLRGDGTGGDDPPDAVVMRQFDHERDRKALLERVNAHPGSVGYGIPAKSRMEFDGRKFRAMGEEPVTVCLPTSGYRRGNFDRLAPGHWEDHIAMVRAAVARFAVDAFPPAVPDPPFVKKGTLVLIGGGATPKRALRKFVEVAGGENAVVVVIPTAKDDVPRRKDYEKTVELFREFGAGSVTAMHARTAAEADSAAFAGRLGEATGIFFTGGRQWRLVDKYSGTRSHDAIRKVLARGGVVGGSSAGATICGDYLVRGNPLGPRQMMAEGYEKGLGLFPGTAIDQHFTQRSRSRDMEALKKRYPQLLGFGIDEATALIIKKDRLHAVGRGTVFIYERPADGSLPPPLVRLQDEEFYSLTDRKKIPAPLPSPFD